MATMNSNKLELFPTLIAVLCASVGFAQTVLLNEDFRTDVNCVIGENMQAYPFAKHMHELSNGVLRQTKVISGLIPSGEIMPLYCDSCTVDGQGQLVQVIANSGRDQLDFSAYVKYFVSTPDITNWRPHIWATEFVASVVEETRCLIEFDLSYIRHFGDLQDTVPFSLAFGGTDPVYNNLDSLSDRYWETCDTLLQCMPFDLTTVITVPIQREGWVHIRQELLLPKGVKYLFMGELHMNFRKSATVDGVVFLVDNIKIVALDR